MLTDWGIAGQQIYRLVKLPALRGAKRIAVGGEEYLLEDYYPRLLSDAEFAELQQLAGQRFRRRGAGEIPGIITGIGLTWCGYCGTALVAQNLLGRRREDGTLADGHRRLHCTSYSKNRGCAAGSCSVAPVERALLGYCSDQLNLERLQQSSDDEHGVRQQLAEARQRVDELGRKLDRVTDALLADDSGAAPLAFVRRARELEQQQAEAQAQVQQIEQQLAARAVPVQPAQAERWAELAARVEAGDYAAREQVRQLVMDTFERLVVYMRGIMPDEKSRSIDMLMVPRNGAPRMIRIDRRSGAWLASEDWHQGPEPLR